MPGFVNTRKFNAVKTAFIYQALIICHTLCYSLDHAILLILTMTLANKNCYYLLLKMRS